MVFKFDLLRRISPNLELLHYTTYIIAFTVVLLPQLTEIRRHRLIKPVTHISLIPQDRYAFLIPQLRNSSRLGVPNKSQLGRNYIKLNDINFFIKAQEPQRLNYVWGLVEQKFCFSCSIVPFYHLSSGMA